MSTYCFVIFEVHYMVFRYNVYFEEYMDLSLRLISGTKSKDTEPMRRIERSGSQIKTTIWLLQRIHVFTILEAPYI